MAISEFACVKLLTDIRSDKTGVTYPAGTVATIVDDVAETYYTAELPYQDGFDVLELDGEQIAAVQQ